MPDQAPDISTATNRLWSLIDNRILSTIKTALNAQGTPRDRPLTVVVPIADSSGPPDVGWLQSVPVWTSCRIAGWEIHSLTAGEVVLDLKLSSIQASPGTAPTLSPINGPGHELSLNGYTTSSMDTNAWANNVFISGDIINVYIISASGIAETVLGLYLTDTQSKVLQS